MPDNTPLRLSELDRRAFLARASVLSLAIPGMGAALGACSPGKSGTLDSTQNESGKSEAPTAAGDTNRLGHHNSDSKLDSAASSGMRHSAPTAIQARF